AGHLCCLMLKIRSVRLAAARSRRRNFQRLSLFLALRAGLAMAAAKNLAAAGTCITTSHHVLPGLGATVSLTISACRCSTLGGGLADFLFVSPFQQTVADVPELEIELVVDVFHVFHLLYDRGDIALEA